MKKLLLVVASVIALSAVCGAAQADILASPPAYGGSNGPVGGQINCRIFNAGLATVTISSRRIITNTGVSVPTSSDSCNVALAPTRYCAFSATIAGNLAHSCRIIANGTEVELRGVAEVVTSGNTILNALPME